MSLVRIIILLTIILYFAFPLHAYEIRPDASIKDTVSSTFSDDRIKGDLGGISDYASNEIALEAVKKNVSLFSGKIKERFSVYLVRSGKYIEMMKNILRENDVPEEIVFLPLIESGFNPNAYSHARAAGYWQFISSTAKRYGLKIDWWKDERRDPVKSTVAAANYLKDLYGIFGSWNLAMAAYNAGEGKILRAISKTKTDDYWSLLKTQHIKNETKNYVPKFIAASLIANSPEDFGFDNLDYHPPLKYDKVTITAPLDIEVIAECSGVSVREIKELNPELRRWCTPPDVPEYTLRIPEGSKAEFLRNLEEMPEEERFTVDIYTVKKGDTFKAISKKTGVPVEAIYDLNNMEKIIPLRAGAEIYLPPKGKFPLDQEDRAMAKKASYKKQKAVSKNKKSAKPVKKVIQKKSKK
jgi:membrane-bound lytic murein transglycosylase D